MTTIAPPRIAWHKGPLASLDLETTGVDTEQDRIVTASIITITPAAEGTARAVDTREWLVNPGVHIPEGATAVAEITQILADIVAAGTPIVMMNAPFDITMLDRELTRHGHPPLSHWMPFSSGMELRPVIDVRVLDKVVDQYRRGGRKLTDLCARYGARIDNAHESTSDALGALRVAYKIAARYPELQIDPHELHARQVRWAAEQTASFAAYRRKIGDPLDDEDGSWPIRPRRPQHPGAAK
jgi:DNA polymerase-3 subunit epsilon